MDNNKDRNIRIGITQGDINGVGYEVILKALENPLLLEMCTPVIYGSLRLALHYRKLLGMQPVQFNRIRSAEEAVDGVVNIIDVSPDDVVVMPGQATVEAGQAAYAALFVATADLREGNIDALVTAPINKNTIQSDAFHFAGHTEYLESQLGGEALMILFNGNVRVALVTTHLPVNRISEAITRQAIIGKLRLFNHSLKADFGIHHPRIAVLGLNPHSGDHGLLGKEEEEVIAPAIAEAQGEKIQCYGPYAADGFFGAGMYARFDGVLAMYHDQGLAPFKTLAMDDGVNFTAGLPGVRTSPDHGTGYDIAGQGVASGQSMRSAIYAAIDICRNRQRHGEATANPLKRQYFDRSKDNVVLDLS